MITSVVLNLFYWRKMVYGSLVVLCLIQFVCLDNAGFVERLGVPPFLSSLWNSLKSLCDGWSWLSTWQTWEEGTSTEEFPPSNWPVSRLLTGVGVPSLLWTLPALGREVWTVSGGWTSQGTQRSSMPLLQLSPWLSALAPLPDPS